LIQCYINIFNNAKDALNNIDDHEKRIIIINAKTDNNQTLIEIQDSAKGIPSDILPKIFDPYFTTKHESIGTGLGLNMTHNLITTSMNGTIKAFNKEFEYENEKYTGALFQIILKNKNI